MNHCRKFKLFGFFLLFINLISCNNLKFNNIHSYYDFGEELMKPDTEYIFYPFENMTANDSISNYEIILSLRITDQCLIKNFPLNIEFASLQNDSIQNKKLNFSLFNEENQKIGKGNFGIYQYKKTLIDKIKPEEGFFITLSTPEQNTQGIISLGIECQTVL